MKIDYELTGEDFVAFHQYLTTTESEHRRNIRKNRWIALVGGGLVVVCGLALGSYSTGVVGAAWMVTGFLMAPLYRWLAARTVRRQARKGDLRSMLVPGRVTLSPEGLIGERPSGTSTLRWSAVDQIGESDSHIFVHEDADRAWIIPKRALEPEPGTEAFLEELRRRTGERGHSVEETDG